MRWTEEEKQHLTGLISRGLSIRDMMQEMMSAFPGREYTKGMIVGVKNRTRIANGHVPTPRPKRPQIETAVKEHKKVIQIVQPVPDHVNDTKRGNTCQYILNDRPPWKKCDAPSHGSWCEEHRRRVFILKSA